MLLVIPISRVSDAFLDVGTGVEGVHCYPAFVGLEAVDSVS